MTKIFLSLILFIPALCTSMDPVLKLVPGENLFYAGPWSMGVEEYIASAQVNEMHEEALHQITCDMADALAVNFKNSFDHIKEDANLHLQMERLFNEFRLIAKLCDVKSRLEEVGFSQAKIEIALSTVKYRIAEYNAKIFGQTWNAQYQAFYKKCLIQISELHENITNFTENGKCSFETCAVVVINLEKLYDQITLLYAIINKISTLESSVKETCRSELYKLSEQIKQLIDFFTQKTWPAVVAASLPLEVLRDGKVSWLCEEQRVYLSGYEQIFDEIVIEKEIITTLRRRNEIQKLIDSILGQSPIGQTIFQAYDRACNRHDLLVDMLLMKLQGLKKSLSLCASSSSLQEALTYDARYERDFARDTVAVDLDFNYLMDFFNAQAVHFSDFCCDEHKSAVLQALMVLAEYLERTDVSEHRKNLKNFEAKQQRKFVAVQRRNTKQVQSEAAKAAAPAHACPVINTVNTAKKIIDVQLEKSIKTINQILSGKTVGVLKNEIDVLATTLAQIKAMPEGLNDDKVGKINGVIRALRRKGENVVPLEAHIKSL